MGDSLCPTCGQFAVVYKQGVNGKPDYYECTACGAKFDASQYEAVLNRDTMQRFPSPKDAEPKSNLQDFLAKKKSN